MSQLTRTTSNSRGSTGHTPALLAGDSAKRGQCKKLGDLSGMLFHAGQIPGALAPTQRL